MITMTRDHRHAVSTQCTFSIVLHFQIQKLAMSVLLIKLEEQLMLFWYYSKVDLPVRITVTIDRPQTV